MADARERADGATRIQKWLEESLGLVDMPAFSTPSLPGCLRRHPDYRFRPDNWLLTPLAERERTVFIIQDAFTSFFDTGVAIDCLKLIEALGFNPRVVPFMPSGKPLQVKGFLPEFERQAQAAQRQLEMLASYDRPMIGLEPSVTLAYADDYPPATGRAAPAIHILESWLASTLSSLESSRRPTTANPADYVLFNHCTATARSSASATQWQQAFAAIRAELSIPRLGCCGMSGVCGHEARHRDTSEAIFALSWQAALADHAGQALVPGYSCRSQAERLTGRRAMHPATALLSRLS